MVVLGGGAVSYERGTPDSAGITATSNSASAERSSSAFAAEDLRAVPIGTVLNLFTEMCSGSEAGSDYRHVQFRLRSEREQRFRAFVPVELRA